MKRLLLATLAGVILFTGCQALPLVSPLLNPYISWVKGESHAYFVADIDSTHRAVQRAVTSLEYSITRDEMRQSGDYYMIAGNDDRFKITVAAAEPYITEVSIRVNIIGDKPYAELIYRELIDELDVIEYETMQVRLKRQRGVRPNS